MSLLLRLLPNAVFARIAMRLLCGHTAIGLCVCACLRPVCPGGLHVEVALVFCPRGTRLGASLGKGADLT
jgi:hypothetical protein